MKNFEFALHKIYIQAQYTGTINGRERSAERFNVNLIVKSLINTSAFFFKVEIVTSSIIRGGKERLLNKCLN